QEESLRVLYVAMTRAKESLSLIWTKSNIAGWSDLFETWLAQNRDPEKTPYRYLHDSEVAVDVVFDPTNTNFETPRALYQDQKQAVNSPRKMSVSQVLETLEKKRVQGLPPAAPTAISLRKWGKAAEGV